LRERHHLFVRDGRGGVVAHHERGKKRVGTATRAAAKLMVCCVCKSWAEPSGCRVVSTFQHPHARDRDGTAWPAALCPFWPTSDLFSSVTEPHHDRNSNYSTWRYDLPLKYLGRRLTQTERALSLQARVAPLLDD
jgi:hypothetical protein